MNKKLLIWLVAILVVVLIAACIIVVVIQPDTSNTPVEPTTTDPVGESATSGIEPTVKDPTEENEIVNSPDANDAENEIGVDDLLNPDMGDIDAPEKDTSGEDTSYDDPIEATEPSGTPELPPDVTEEETTEPDATESMLPEETQIPDDNYSNNWY